MKQIVVIAFVVLIVGYWLTHRPIQVAIETSSTIGRPFPNAS